MSESIRNIRVDEWEPLIRFLERCFGSPKGFFQRYLPHLYQPTPEACAWAWVVEKDGQIVSHVGVYPIETVAAGVRLKIGGIGAVSTLPQERGHGHMSQLLRHAIGVMRDQGDVLSWLGGDRQRYSSYGWEQGGLVYRLHFSTRSLDWHKVEPVQVEEQYLADITPAIEQFHSLVSCYTVRPWLDLQTRKQGLRAWTAADGYAIAEAKEEGRLDILELVSAAGQEAGMLRALMNRAAVNRVVWGLSAWDGERVGRLMPVAAHWEVRSNWQFRIVDLPGLLTAALPHLTRRAAPLRDFAVSVGIREHDRTDAATIRVQDGCVEVCPGRRVEPCVELSSVEAVRLFLGGPPIADPGRIPASLSALLPVPAYVPPLDNV